MTHDDISAGWVDDVLAFWFDELGPDDWFAGGDKLDGTVRRRFAALHAALAKDLPAACRLEARPALAAIVALDQFPRNIHRRSAQAFSTDDIAVALARNAVDRGLDAGIDADQLQFLYMPFQHSENVADQERAVALFKTLGDEEALRYAVEHRDIILKFGRFPHRNQALGRESTKEELEFLAGHGGFGQ